MAEATAQLESTAAGRGSGESTPAPAGDQAGDGAPTTANDQAGGAREAAPLEAKAELDGARRAFDALENGKTAEEARTIAKRPATPAADDTRGGGDAPPADAAGVAAELSPQGKAAPLNKYAGLEEGSYHAMNRVGLLPTPEDWASLPSHARGHAVSAAKAVLKARTEAYEAKQKLAAAGQGAADTTKGAAGGDAAGDGLDDDEQLHEGGVGAAGAGRADAGAAGSDEELFEKIRDYYGDDTLVTPLKQLLDRRDQNYRQELAGKDAANRQLFGELAAMQASTAFDSLSDEIPQLKDGAVQRDVLRLAGSIYQTERSAGDGLFTFGKAVVQAARAKFQPDLKQQAQRELGSKREQQIRGGSERVGGDANGVRAMTSLEQQRAIYDALEAGKTVEEARAVAR